MLSTQLGAMTRRITRAERWNNFEACAGNYRCPRRKELALPMLGAHSVPTQAHRDRYAPGLPRLLVVAAHRNAAPSHTMLVIGSLGSSPYTQQDARGPLLPSVPLTNSLNSPHEARDDHEVISGPVSHRSPANFLCPGPSGSTGTAREQAGDRRGCHQMPNSSRLLRKISPFGITASYETHSLTPQETRSGGNKAERLLWEDTATGSLPSKQPLQKTA